MKLPIPKEDDGKRMLMMAGASTGRKGLLGEHKERNFVGGNDIENVQYRVRTNMDLGSGDSYDFYGQSTDIQNNYDSFNWEPRFESHDFPPAKTHTWTATSPPSAPSPPSSPLPPLPPLAPSNPESSSSESLNKNIFHRELSTENAFKAKEYESSEGRSATLAVVEDGKEGNLRVNESNPTVPAPSEPSKTSTLRLSDRTRSESEDDIEKMDEPEQEGTLIGHKTLYKTSATTENSPNSDKIDKNGNRSDLNENEADDECVVQCLYYTIECCECVIS